MTDAQAERDAVVAWLRAQNELCDCFARSENDCQCGAWWSEKNRNLLQLAAEIEAGDHIKAQGGAG